MLTGPLVFVDVDTQNDFFPSGALPIPGAQAILGHLQRLTEHARTHAIPVLATACAHQPDDAELREFPPHCMVGTAGERRVAATTWEGSVVLAPEQTFEGPIPAHLTAQKRSLDLFSRPDADRLVDLYNQARPLFVVYGLATDYCVRCAVLGLLGHGCRVAVVADAIRAIDAAHEPAVFAEFLERGAVLTVQARVTRPTA